MPANRPEIINEARPGDELTVRRWNQVVHAVNRSVVLPGFGIRATSTPMGTIIGITGYGVGFPAYSSTAITARSGSTAGKGSVNPVQLNVSSAGSGTLTTATSATYGVWNISSTSIASGKYCWVEQGQDGNLYVGPLEC